MTQIFVEQNKLRIKYENICICNIYSLNNDSIRETSNQKSVNPFSILSGAKEDGNVAYQLDYAYATLFSEDLNTWKLSRYDEYGKFRKYIKLASAKPSRVGIDSGNPIFIWQKGRFILPEDINEKNKVDLNGNSDNYNPVNNENECEEEIQWQKEEN